MVASLLSPSIFTQKTLPSSFSKFSSFYFLPVALFFSLFAKTVPSSFSWFKCPAWVYLRRSFCWLFVFFSYLRNSNVQFFKQCLVLSLSVDIYPLGYGSFTSKWPC